MRDLEKKNGGLTTYNAFDQDQQKNEKPLYKLKMFQDVGSKVAEEVKLFKTYHPYRKKKKVDDGVDYLINKVQGEIEQNNKQKLDEPMNNPQPMEQNFNLNQNEINNKINEMKPVPEAVPQ